MNIKMQLFQIERIIKQVKTLHDLGKIPVKQAKREIMRLGKEYNDILNEMPKDDRKNYQPKILEM